jgi:hypothetical protein
MTPLIPYEEVLLSPNREPADRLFALVKKQWVLTRDAWPMWARLVQKYGWRTVIQAAEQCHPEKRYVNNVEAFCLELSKQEAEAEREAKAKSGVRPALGDHKERAATFAAIRARIIG